MVYFLHRPDISANEGASVTARKNGCPSSPWCCQRADKHRATSTVTKDLRNSSSHMCHVTVASGRSLDVLWTEWLFLSVCMVHYLILQWDLYYWWRQERWPAKIASVLHKDREWVSEYFFLVPADPIFPDKGPSNVLLLLLLLRSGICKLLNSGVTNDQGILKIFND